MSDISDISKLVIGQIWKTYLLEMKTIYPPRSHPPWVLWYNAQKIFIDVQNMAEEQDRYFSCSFTNILARFAFWNIHSFKTQNYLLFYFIAFSKFLHILYNTKFVCLISVNDYLLFNALQSVMRLNHRKFNKGKAYSQATENYTIKQILPCNNILT